MPPAPRTLVPRARSRALLARQLLLERSSLAIGDGRDLFDLAGAPLPDLDTPAPVRFLPHWDANLLVHARRTGVLPEPYRARVFSTRNPFSVGTVLVDGRVVAGWSIRDGRVAVDRYEELSTADARAVESEREALEAFHA